MRLAIIAVTVIYFGLRFAEMGDKFVAAKIANDSSIAVDTRRIAVALEAKK